MNNEGCRTCAFLKGDMSVKVASMARYQFSSPWKPDFSKALTLYVANQGVMMKLRFGGKAVPT